MNDRPDPGLTIDPDGLAATPSGGTLRPSSPPEPLPVPPGYEILGALGEGGMGIVYRALDRRLDRPVALKYLRPGYRGDAATAARFLHEARVTARLQHPGIPPVYEVGTLDDGRPFLAMKLIEGRTLAEQLREQGPGAGRWLGVFDSICQAVAYAHSQGVIHRDLKPANVMVGAFGEVQVMDWGLAKVLPPAGVSARREPDDPDATRPHRGDSGPAPGTEETRAGTVLGTPAFMAPEQAIGAIDRVDRRSDVFGLGAMLCVLLTGRPAFVAPDSESTRQLAARAKLDDAFARLDGSGTEPELVALAKRCLAAEPDHRPADAGVLAEAVAALRRQAEERARHAEIDRARALVQAAEQRKRRHVQLGLAAAVGLLILTVAGGLWVVDDQLRKRRYEKLQVVTTAVARLEQLRDQCREYPPTAETAEDAQQAQRAWDRTAFALEEAGHLLAISEAEDPALAARITDLRRDVPAGQAAAKELVKRTRTRMVWTAEAEVAVAKGQNSLARAHFSRAIKADPDHPLPHILAGDLACRRGEYAAALARYRAAVPLANARDSRPKPQHQLVVSALSPPRPPATSADLAVRAQRAAYLAREGPALDDYVRKNRPVPASPAEQCDLAELFLIAGHYGRSAALYARAFESDPKLVPAHRASAALAATLGGCGLGEDRADLTAAQRRALRDQADRWLPRPVPKARSLEEAVAAVVRLDGFDPARYRFVRAVLRPRTTGRDWSGTMITVEGDPSEGKGFNLPHDLKVGFPFPTKKALANQLRGPAERNEVGTFLDRVVPRHLLLDLACDVFPNPTSGGVWGRFAATEWALD